MDADLKACAILEHLTDRLLAPAWAQDTSAPLGPPPDSIPEGPVGDAIRLGHKIVSQTPVYAEKCASCHGADGQGKYGEQGQTFYPPLWGPRSFNIGAGMGRLNTAAAFVKANMPGGQGGTLTDQEAFDVAAYFTQQPRPDFADKDKDWPLGGKPKDARY